GLDEELADRPEVGAAEGEVVPLQHDRDGRGRGERDLRAGVDDGAGGVRQGPGDRDGDDGVAALVLEGEVDDRGPLLGDGCGEGDHAGLRVAVTAGLRRATPVTFTGPLSEGGKAIQLPPFHMEVRSPALSTRSQNQTSSIRTAADGWPAVA